MAKVAKPFRYRGRWRMQVTLPNGSRPCKDFDNYADAQAWGNEQLARAKCEHAPVLGGPTQSTLAQALDHYARHFSIAKKGVSQELTRINQYLEATDLPLLKVRKKPEGGIEIVERQDQPLRAEFARYVDERRQVRAGTFTYRHKLAQMKCSRISAAHIQGFYAQMVKDGLSESSIQKEIALLKAFFNSVKRMNWQGVDNPCEGIKLGKSLRRFVSLTEEKWEALMQELERCENPYFLPLVLVAKESTLRLDTLVNMTWNNTHVEGRSAMLPTKTGQRMHALSREVQAILATLPQVEGEDRIFPMSKSAINSMWDRVRKKCGLPTLQFRDLRHLGATDWARRGLGANALKNVLGHDSITTAQFYIDMVGADITAALDRASDTAGVVVVPPEFPSDPKAFIKQRQGERFQRALQRAKEDKGRALLQVPAEPEVGSSMTEASEAENTPLTALAAAAEAAPATNVIALADFRRRAA